MNSIHHEVRMPETDYHLQHQLSAADQAVVFKHLCRDSHGVLQHAGQG